MRKAAKVALSSGGRQVQALRFAGTTNYTGGLNIFGADSQVATVSFWARLNADTAVMRLLHAGNCTIRYSATNQTMLFAFNQAAGGSVVFQMQVKCPKVSGGWAHFAVACDMANSISHGYVNGESSVYALDTFTASSTIDWTRAATNYTFGGNTNLSGELWAGDLAEFWMDTTVCLNLGDPTVLQKFIRTKTAPADLGFNGERVTGTAPSCFLTGPAATFTTNRGTSGTNLTLANGGVVDTVLYRARSN